jgi:hypothetical protein
MAGNGFVSVETQGRDEERDEDFTSMDDGNFDDTDGIFDGGTDAEGVFADQTSVFSTPRAPSADHSNALTTREMEARRYEDAKPSRQLPVARAVYNKRAGFKPQPKRVLVAQFDAQGRPAVARFAGGQQLESFRPPTLAEFHSLKNNGRIVKGGIGQAPTPGLPWKKIAVGGSVLAVGGLAWYFWKKRKQDQANTVVQQVPESNSAFEYSPYDDASSGSGDPGGSFED